MHIVAGLLIAQKNIDEVIAVIKKSKSTTEALENLEKKIGGIAVTKSSTQDLENRFAAIETSVTVINKSIDKGITIEIREIHGQINTMAVNISALQTRAISLEKQVDKLEDADSNPLLD